MRNRPALSAVTAVVKKCFDRREYSNETFLVGDFGDAFCFGCGTSDKSSPEVTDKDTGSKTAIESFSAEEQFEQLNMEYAEQLKQTGSNSTTVADQYAGKFLELALSLIHI